MKQLKRIIHFNFKIYFSTCRDVRSMNVVSCESAYHPPTQNTAQHLGPLLYVHETTYI